MSVQTGFWFANEMGEEFAQKVKDEILWHSAHISSTEVCPLCTWHDDQICCQKINVQSFVVSVHLSWQGYFWHDDPIRFFCSKLNFQSLVVSVHISWQGYLWHDDQDFLSEIHVQSFVVCFATSSREEYQRVFQWGLHFFTSKHQYWKRPSKV